MVFTEEERKQRRKETQAKYRKNNKEKIKEINAKYTKNNKEKINIKNENYRKNNKEKIKEVNAKYYINNKEVINKRNKEYNKTPKGKKIHKFNSWKQMGINIDNFDELYEKYLTTTNCENCNVKLTSGGYNSITTRCLDHNHETGEFRNILCHLCNIRIK